MIADGRNPIGRSPARRGFSLVETAISTVIVGLVLVVALRTVGSATSAQGDNAERLRRTLQQGLARQVRVIPATTGAGSVHRVQVGPLTSVELADQVSAQMHQLGVSEPLVVID